jgi:hypothetical protein
MSLLEVRHLSFRTPTQRPEEDDYFLYAILRKAGQSNVNLACISNSRKIEFPAYQSFNSESDAISFLRVRQEHKGLICLRYAWHEIRPDSPETVDGFELVD